MFSDNDGAEAHFSYFNNSYATDRYSFENYFYPDNSLNSEMYRLFSGPPLFPVFPLLQESTNTLDSSGYSTGSSFSPLVSSSPKRKSEENSLINCVLDKENISNNNNAIASYSNEPLEDSETQESENMSVIQPQKAIRSRCRNRSNKQNKEICCKFCQKIGQPFFVYKGHQTKNKNGMVTCPILRTYTCPLCGATGRNAHTKKYCEKYVEN